MGIISREKKVEKKDDTGIRDRDQTSSEDTLSESSFYTRPTFLRVLVALLYLIAVVFLVLVEIGNINNNPVIRDTWFLKIDLANIIPETVPNAVLINTIAQTLGLHDFYQVGLWNYCAGYNGRGITYCSPRTLAYWFNPVEIIISELLVGASIALPTDIVETLDLVQLASTWMFACFMAGIVLSFLCIFFAPMGFSKKPRWSHKAKRIFLRQLPVTILTFLALLFTAAGATIGTVMFVIFRNVVGGAAEFNIQAYIGTKMLAFEWVAVGLLMLGFITQIGTCCGVCCCTGKSRAMKKRGMSER